jgi:hypothetical protein
MPRGPRGEKRPADVIGATVMVANIATASVSSLRRCRRQVAATENQNYPLG